MANTPEKPQMTDDERAELRAMIAAGRDLSPDMDESLVDSYAERRAAEKKAQAKVQGNAVVAQQQPGSPFAGVHPAVAITGLWRWPPYFHRDYGVHRRAWLVDDLPTARHLRRLVGE